MSDPRAQRSELRDSGQREFGFDRSGPATIRVQVKEDGFSIDQIVLSAGKYVTAAPGPLKNDATLLNR